MTVTNFAVQQVLRTYHRQLAEKTRLSREKVYRKTLQPDSVTISPESKKRLLTDRITQEITNQFLSGSERNETMDAIMGQLSQEYGKPLDVSTDGQNLVFKVLSQGNGQEAENLSPAENEQLNKNFIDITKAIVYTNLV
jgi:predicted HAD superfamily phosphohydrolase